jgi:multidrug resistance efflux pump
MMKQLAVPASIILAVLLVALALLGRAPAAAEPTRADDPSAVSAPSPAAMRRPADGPQNLRMTLPGVLRADEMVDLYAKVSGYVGSINVDYGSRVRKGDVLITVYAPEILDDLHQSEASLNARKARVEALKAKAEQARLNVEAARAEQARAVAERDLSQITFTRKQELVKGKAIPPQEFDEAKSQFSVAQAKVAIAQAGIAGAEGAEGAAQADVKAAEADVALAQAEVARAKTLVNYMTIRAPFDGVITRRDVDEGAFIRSAAQVTGMPLLVVAKLDRLRLVLDIPEAQASRVTAGTQTDFQITSVDASPRRMSVTRTAVAIRPDTRTMRAEIDIDNRSGQLAPGMYAQAVVHLNSSQASRPGE